MGKIYNSFTLVVILFLIKASLQIIINPLTMKDSIEKLQYPNNSIDLSSIERDGYFIQYEFSNKSPGRIKILFQQPLNETNWFGMGFNYLMHKSHMIIIQFVGGYIDIYEAYSQDYSFPQAKEITSLDLIGYYEDQQSKYILVEADFHENDKNYISIAYGSTQTMQFHGRRKGRYIIPLEPGIAVNKNDEVIVINIIYKLHTTWLTYGWGYLADFCIISIRYLKGWKYYITLHSSLFFILNLFTVIIEFLLIYYNLPRIYNISYLDIYLHFILGTLFLAIVVFQHLSGYFLKRAIEDEKVQLMIPRIKQIHKYIGYSLYILGKIAIFTGKWASTILKNSNKSRYLSMKDSLQDFTLIWILWIMIEGLYNKGYIQKIIYQNFIYLMKKAKIKKNNLSQSEKNLLMSLINKQNTIYEIEQQFPNLNYCIIGQKVYDLTGFMHPGGNYMLKLINGQEVQRYLNGQQHIEGFQNSVDKINKPFTHPISSILFLKEKYIGTIDYNERSILYFSQNTLEIENENKNYELIRKQSEEIDDINEKINVRQSKETQNFYSISQEEKVIPLIHDNYNFQIVKKDKFLIYFQNSNCTVRNTMKGLSWLGLHFSIYKKQNKNSKNRLYTTVLCMTEYNQRKRKQISQFLRNKNLNVQFKVQHFDDKLPFIIKKYNSEGAFSKYIHENQDHIYKIEGPLGVGLEMSDQFDGNIAIIANGTGILPFLDLLNYYLQKNAYLYAKKLNKQQQFLNLFEQSDEDFSYMLNTNIYLYCSFENLNNFYGHEIVQDILKSEELLGIKNFHLTLKMKDIQQLKNFKGDYTIYENYFDKNLINQIQPTVLKDVERIYVSGSYDLTFAISEALRSTSNLSQKLFYV
ncbi:hypothetical protein ABPG74_013707 [Tetrahymena malaccensis]